MRAAEISLVATDLRGINESFMEPDAKLEAVPIYRPDLHGAHLYYADLRGADLSGADLSDTLLRDADMRGANVSNVGGITNEQLEQQAASLEGATMPDGSEHP